MQSSIRTRLLIAFIGMATIPLLLVGVILVVQSYQVQQREAILSQHQEALRISTQVSAFVTGLENQLNMIITVRGLKDLTLEQKKSILTELLAYQNNFEGLS